MDSVLEIYSMTDRQTDRQIMDSVLEIYSVRETDRQRQTEAETETNRQTDRRTEKSCTVLTTDGIVPHQNFIGHSPNPAFLMDVVNCRCLEFNLIKM